MSITGSLFRMVAPGLVDNLEAQGLFKGSSRVAPSLVPEMFIGREGISNLGAAGVLDAPAATNLLENAQRDWFKLPAEEWNALYPSSGIAFDPVANKAMLEISDKNVDLRKGVDLNKLPANEVLTFDELFKADVLKKAYPDIGDVTVSFLDDPTSSRLAAFAPEQNMILFNRQHPDWRQADTPLNVAVHEIQHYVQGKELFTKGESFTKTLNENQVFTQSNEAMPLVIAKALPESLQFAKQFKGIGFDKDSVIDAIAGFTAKDGLSARASLTKAFRSKDMADKFIANAQNYPALSGVLKIKDISSAAYQKSISDYMGVAGEVFARQTEQRRGMNVSERLAQPAMRAIETDPLNRKAGITIDNMTAPRAGSTEQSAYIVPEWNLKEQTKQERDEGFSRKLNNPIKLQDGSRLSGFTSNSQEVFYGYDKNGEIFTIRKEFVKPEDIVSSRDSNKTADKIRSRLLELQKPTDFADPFAMQVPQSTIPEGM